MHILILSWIFISQSLLATSVLVVDMPVKKETLPPETAKLIKEVINFHKPTALPDNCDILSTEIEKYFQFNLTHKVEKVSSLKHLNEFDNFIHQVHGEHILNLVAKGLNNVQIYHLGASRSPDYHELKNLDNYLNNKLENELQFIKTNIKRIHPDYVNISASETIEENVQVFLDAGIDKKIAYANGKRIYEKWDQFWRTLFLELPATKFIVSAGNGGLDWQGDDLDDPKNINQKTTPAMIKLNNVIVVGSKKNGNISSFSNKSLRLNAFENGEEVNSQISCPKRKWIKFTGTSQATAIHTNKLIKLEAHK